MTYIKNISAILVSALLFLIIGITISPPKASAAMTLCLNGQSAEAGKCQEKYGVGEAPESVRVTCGGYIDSTAKNDCIRTECARFNCQFAGENEEYDGRILCSNGEYGTGTYNDGGNCSNHPNSEIVPESTASECGKISSSVQRLNCINNSNQSYNPNKGQFSCGGGSDAYRMTFDIGCKGVGNPIMDALFALIRFLSAGVGVILVGAMIVTGIQHTMSRDKPEATANLMKRLLTIAGALLLYGLIYAILNFLVPGGLLVP